MKGRIVANDTPRNLVVTLAPSPTPREESSELTEQILSMDAPADQAQLAAWMAQGSVRAIHSREATLEEIFMSVDGSHPV